MFIFTLIISIQTEIDLVLDDITLKDSLQLITLCKKTFDLKVYPFYAAIIHGTLPLNDVSMFPRFVLHILKGEIVVTVCRSFNVISTY